MAELPLEESAETAKAGNYSPSLERVLFKLLSFLFYFLSAFKFLKTKSSHSQPLLTAVTHKAGRNWNSPQANWKRCPGSNQKGGAPLITHCNVKPDMERMATAEQIWAKQWWYLIIQMVIQTICNCFAEAHKVYGFQSFLQVTRCWGSLALSSGPPEAAFFILSRPGCSTQGTMPTSSMPSLALGKVLLLD